MAGWRGFTAVWPAVLVCGGSFALVQFLMANVVGAALVDVVGGIASLVALAVFLKWWQPAEPWRHGTAAEPHGSENSPGFPHDSARRVAWAWMPWAFLSLAVFLWGLPAVKAVLEGRSLRAPTAAPAATAAKAADGPPLLPRAFVAPEFPVPRLDGRVAKVPPATREPFEIERAVYRLNWLAAAGTGILVAALVSVPWLGIGWRRAGRLWCDTLLRLGPSLLTISLMLALAFVTRYSGTDVTLGLALTQSGSLYPFFAPLLGWLGVALTGTDAGSNALFGNLQKVTAEQLGISAVLMASANSAGGVMGKMIDAQSIVVSSAATQQAGNEAAIFKAVFKHSIVLAALVGIIVMLYAFVFPGLIPE